MLYEKLEQEDGSFLIRQTRDDGSTRLVDEDYHGYLDYIKDNEVAIVEYVAPLEPEPIPEHKPIVLTTQQKLDRTDYELTQLMARQFEDITNERIADGKFVPQAIINKIAEREALRAEL